MIKLYLFNQIVEGLQFSNLIITLQLYYTVYGERFIRVTAETMLNI
jgi:hypothetical protein